MSQFIQRIMPSRRTTGVAVAAFPLLLPKVTLVTLSPTARLWISAALIVLSIAAVGSYVTAVNTMLFTGRSVEQHRQTLRGLELERSQLQDLAARQHAPSWLEKASSAQGMVAADDIRYLRENDSLARMR